MFRLFLTLEPHGDDTSTHVPENVFDLYSVQKIEHRNFHKISDINTELCVCSCGVFVETNGVGRIHFFFTDKLIMNQPVVDYSKYTHNYCGSVA